MTPAVITRDEWLVLTAEEIEKNGNRNVRYKGQDNPCRLCGCQLTQKAYENAWFVRMTVNGDLVQKDAEVAEADDQGWFPIGTGCAKKIPIQFRKKF